MLIDITLGGGNGVGSVGRGRDDLAQRLGTDISRREDTGNTGYPILSGDDISPLVQIRQPLDLTGIRTIPTAMKTPCTARLDLLSSFLLYN